MDYKIINTKTGDVVSHLRDFDFSNVEIEIDSFTSEDFKDSETWTFKGDAVKVKLECSVCGSEDVIEVPHMGINCNNCNPL